MASETDQGQHDPLAEDVPTFAPVAPANALEALRARRAEIGADLERDFPVPGYGGMLIARYRRLEWAEARKAIMSKVKPNQPVTGEAELEGQIAFLAKACIGVYLGGGDLVQLSPNYGPEVLEALDIQLPRKLAADVITAVFNNTMAIPAHQAVVMRWMQGSEGELAEEFSGE
jgi:hypothetical protein